MNEPPALVPDALAAASNETLRATVAGLVAGEPAPQLLGRLLRDAAAVCGAHVGLMFTLDRASGRPRAAALVHHGQLVDIDADPVHRVWRGLEHSEQSSHILRRLRHVTSVRRMADIRDTLWPPGQPWHDAMGHRFLMMVPLLHRGVVVGALGLGFADEPALDPPRQWAMDALTHQLSLVVVQAAAAEDAREAVRIAERSAATDRRAAELDRSDRAMQRVIDAMTSLGDLSTVVPAALQAAAEAFDIEAAGFFEVVGGLIFLRFWLHEGRVLGPDQLPHLGDHLSLVRDMAHGFQVPPEHLGEHFLRRSRPVLIDHGTATASPALHRFACDMGWRHELNVPLMIDGLAAGAITLFRPPQRPFEEGDVTLAVLLSKQLALAMQAANIAERARQLALVAERNRLAADIHDSLAQSFTSIALQCEVLGARLPEASAERRTADLIERTARRGLAEARASVQALRALPEGDDALAEALTELAEHCTVRGSIDCRFEQRPGRCAMSASAQETVLRVAQEAANNAMKHARCKTLRMHLDWDERDVILTVRDDGRGLPNHVGGGPADGSGYGLPGMSQRAASQGGTCDVTSVAGHGVTVTLRLPRAR